MQILIGTEYTTIAIDESKINTYNLFTFIKSQFPSHTINQNKIFLTYSAEEHFKHLFLLKWIYAIHKKVNKMEIENLRDVLINRIEKPIQIITKREINPKNTIILEVFGIDSIRFTFTQKNYQLFFELQYLFKKSIRKISYQNNFFEIDVVQNTTRDKINKLLETKGYKDIDLMFQYNESDLYLLLNEEKEVNHLLNKALSDLGSELYEDINTIKKRYKKLLVKYHPDNVYQEGTEKINEYTEIFKNLQVSFEIIQSQHF